jgi:hypothetical protein
VRGRPRRRLTRPPFVSRSSRSALRHGRDEEYHECWSREGGGAWAEHDRRERKIQGAPYSVIQLAAHSDLTDGIVPASPKTNTAAPISEANARRVLISGTARTLGIGAPLGTGAPLAGMSVCALHQGIICTGTQTDGTWTLPGVAANSAQTLIFTKGGQFPSAALPDGHSIPFVTALENAVIPANETAFASAADVAQLSGKPADPAKGSIVFFATELGADLSLEFASGVTVQADGLDGAVPLFLDRSGKAVTGATATAGSWGVFVDVPPGQYKVTFKHPTAACSAVPVDSSGASNFDTEQTIDVSVIAGAVSGPVQVFCPFAASGAQ